ncbi:MAG: V-type ATP synthase subunit I [Chloroflexota bacterium]
MAVLRVKKATIVAERTAQASLLEALQAFGNFELTDLREAAESLDVSPPPEGNVDAAAKARVKQALDLLARYESQKSGIVETFVDVKYAMTLSEYRQMTDHDYFAVVDRVQELDARLTALQEERKQAEALAETLRPLRNLVVPLENLVPTSRCNVILGAVPLAEAPSLEADLLQVREEHHEIVGQDGRSIYVLAIHLTDDQRVPQALSAHGFVPLTLTGLRGLPVHCLAEAEVKLAQIDKDVAAAEDELRAIAADDIRLKAVYDGFLTAEQRQAASDQALNTPHLIVVQGWVATKRASALEQAVRGACQGAEVIFADPGEGDTPPVILDNPAITEPFQMVTNIYGAPAYHEMDPTPWLAPFFAIFFGTALGDAGYGLFMSIFFFIGMRKWNKLTWAGKRLNRLLVIIGLVSIVMGLATGSFFGDLTAYLPFPALNALRARLTLIDPMANPLGMMVVALAMGVVQVYTGVIAKFVAVVRGGSLTDAILDQGMWLLYLGGFVLMALATFGILPAALAPAFKYVGFAGVLGILLFAGRANRNPLARIGVGLYALYGTINYIADVLSYSRLLALGLAGAVIGVVVNQLGFMAGGFKIAGIPFGIVFVVAILAGGHLFNLGISAFGAFIHCARLQFVEYFSKFYEGGGRYIDPFRWKGKYTLIREYTE